MKKSDRQIVFNKYGGKCAYCGCDLQKGWHVDHLEPVQRVLKYTRDRGLYTDGEMRNPERDTMENYNPSCASCNILKSDSSIENFRKRIGDFVNSLNLYHTQYKFAKKYGLVQETNDPVVFYFERFTNQ